MTLTEDLVKAINTLIYASIMHGGDPGGPYFSEKEAIEKSVKDLKDLIDPENALEIVWYTNESESAEAYFKRTSRGYEWENLENEQNIPVLRFRNEPDGPISMNEVKLH